VYFYVVDFLCDLIRFCLDFLQCTRFLFGGTVEISAEVVGCMLIYQQFLLNIEQVGSIRIKFLDYAVAEM